MAKDKSKISPSDNFVEMMRDFGSAVAEIFNDPNLKEKAKEFGESAAASAKTFASRFKDEDVKKKFKDLGSTAKNFGDSVAAYFKDDAKESGNEETAEDAGTEEKSGDSPGDEDDEEAELKTSTQPSSEEAGISRVVEKQSGPAEFLKGIKEPGLDKSERHRNARITGYCFAIAWSIIFIVFFNFFNRYIAIYLFDSQSETWIITPAITGSFEAWLPFLNAALLVAVVGNIILIINDSFYFDNIANIVMHLFSISSAAALLILFPFDFTLMSTSVLSAILGPTIRIILIIIIIGLSIGVIVRFIKIVVRAARSQ